MTLECDICGDVYIDEDMYEVDDLVRCEGKTVCENCLEAWLEEDD